MNEFMEWLTSGKLIASVIIIVAAVVLWQIIKRAFNKAIAYTEERDGRTNQTARGVKRIIKYAIIIIVALALFQANGINVTSLITSLGIASAVIGFAAQEFLKDIFMGIHITTDNFYKVGDVLKYKDYIGVVQKFTMQTTQIKDIYTRNIINISNRNLDIAEVMSGMVDLRIGLSYNEDFEKVHRVMEELARTLPARVEGITESIYKGTSEFNESTINYMISIFMEPAKVPQLRRNVLMEIQKEFRKNDIVFPFPQLDVHFDGEPDIKEIVGEEKEKEA